MEHAEGPTLKQLAASVLARTRSPGARNGTVAERLFPRGAAGRSVPPEQSGGGTLGTSGSRRGRNQAAPAGPHLSAAIHHALAGGPLSGKELRIRLGSPSAEDLYTALDEALEKGSIATDPRSCLYYLPPVCASERLSE